MISRILAIIMLPVGALILLEAFDIFSLNILISKVLLGAILMIALQVLNLVMGKMKNGMITMMQIITAIIFIIPPVLYFFAIFAEYMPMAIGVMMIIESLYALH